MLTQSRKSLCQSILENMQLNSDCMRAGTVPGARPPHTR